MSVWGYESTKSQRARMTWYQTGSHHVLMKDHSFSREMATGSIVPQESVEIENAMLK